MSTATAFPPFVLTEGGPCNILLQRMGLGSPPRRAWQIALVLAATTWVPLLVLSAIGGVALRGPTIPFVDDLAAHVRCLVAVPVLVLAEIPIGVRIRQIAVHFVDAGLVRREQQPRFAESVLQALRFRDSRVAELLVLAAAYATTYTALATSIHSGSTWYTPESAARMAPVGYWYVFVSMPIYQFLLFRWAYRMFVWAQFLRAMSRLDLQLTATHPDGAGGLGFLGRACVPFGVLLFAMSAVLSSAIASRVLFEGARLESFWGIYLALLVISLAIFSGPVLAFVPKLARLKYVDFLQYGTLASRYTQLFERKWVNAVDATEDPLLGTSDIQSLADLGNSYQLVRKMRVVPIELRDFAAMAIPGFLPVLPLAATVMPVSEILKGLLQLLH
jgi:hypothetical protein